MDKTRTNELFRRYPRTFRNREESSMQFGFACEDGWFSLIEEIAAVVEAEIRRLAAAGVPEERLPVAVQVKEKLGGLRFYVSGERTPATDEVIRRISEAADRTCEVCGAPGVTRRGGYIQTLCDACCAARGHDPVTLKA